MSTYEMNPCTCAYIESLGIDPNRVGADDWDAEGYTYHEGEPPFGNVKIRRQWPDGLDYKTLLAHWAADAPSRR
jgi:hypothetical protein